MGSINRQQRTGCPPWQVTPSTEPQPPKRAGIVRLTPMIMSISAMEVSEPV